jgi:hypothetical protein
LAKVKSVSSSNQGKVSRTRIILADDHPLMRHALRDVIEKQPDFKVIAEAIDGEDELFGHPHGSTLSTLRILPDR